MDAEDMADYLEWLNAAYQRAYAEGILTLDEYRKYQEEVFDGLRDLFDDYLNDIEHEISMREHFDEQSGEILALYQELIAAVEAQIQTAMAQGLDNNDDYIQELQDKWWQYHDAIEDLQNDVSDNAKDATEELIQIRIKMLKEEIQREKDAIKERLDALKDFYQKQKDMLRDQYDEEKYLREQSEKRKAVEDILAELAQLEYDDSAWAQRRRLELQQQLAEAQQDLDDFEHDHALEVAQDELDQLYEMQEEELNNQLDLLEEQENDAQALYQQALDDIRNGSIELYEEMIEWNRLYGDGIEDTIKNAWEEAYKALQEYMDLYGEYYNGIHLGNYTGYDPGGTWDDHPIYAPPSSSSGDSGGSSGGSGSSGGGSGSSGGSGGGSSETNYPYGKASETKGTIKKGDRGRQVKAIQYALNALGFGNSGTEDVDGIFGAKTKKAVKNFQTAMKMDGPNGIVGNKTRKKFAKKGYASGTSSATPGIHEIDEIAPETIFESIDGNRYKLFTGGEKVLDAKASDFLYKFATNGRNLFDYFVQGAFHSHLPGITPPIKHFEINMGDIVVEGNASQQTISQIRRAQRESVDFMLKELNKLNKK
jgi:hypothetical protein